MSTFPMALPPKAGMVPEVEEEIVEGEMPVEAEATPVTIAPEAVCYRDGQQVCGNCTYMGETGECSALKIQVSPGDGCNLFQERGL